MERLPPGVRAIFDQAREIDSPGERAAFLDRTCADAPDVRGEVEALLRAGDDAGSFLETPAVGRQVELAAASGADDTRTAPPAPDGGESLDFLTPSDEPGALGRLGHYEVLEVVGRGGMGIVLRAFDAQLHRVVAVKVMAAQLATGATARKRFTREARAAAAVSHDHVVTIYAVEDSDRLPYIVMQYVAGASLQDRLDRTGPLPLPEILRIGMQTASGLAAAHAQGLVHRDVKPANILLENGVERVKLTDFGLARAADDASLTGSGVVAGTPSYMSPEQAEGKPVDHRSDLFSLGSVLYAMCTGRPPFRASTTMAVLKRVCEESPTPIHEANPELPDWLAAVIRKLHAKDPADRFQSAAEVADLLGAKLADLQRPAGVAPLPAPPAPARRPRWAGAAAALAVVLGGLGAAEATGMTAIRAAVARVFTPDGKPVVEPDGPGVKVKPEGVPVRPAAQVDRGAFVVLVKGVEVRDFYTLADAVLDVRDGDTIEIRDNGPLVTKPVNLGKTPLTIRAGAGFRPVIRLHGGTQDYLFQTQAPLVVEGLELQNVSPGSTSQGGLIAFRGGSLHVCNCRLISTPRGPHVLAGKDGPAVCELRNCELLTGSAPSVAWGLVDGRFHMDNCVLAGGGVIGMVHEPGRRNLSVSLNRSTFVGRTLLTLTVGNLAKAIDAKADLDPVRFQLSHNVIAGPESLWVFHGNESLSPENWSALLPALPRLVGWRQVGNLYDHDHLFVARQPMKVAEWRKLWRQSDSGCKEGAVRFRGGNFVAKRLPELEQLAAGDFRLRADSAGYRAGPDGKDLGADVDLVGPGAAYERWKTTPDYQKWLKDTEQRK